MREQRAQVAIEFMVTVGLAMIMLILLAGVIYFLTKDYSEEKNLRRLLDYGYSLQNEIILASEVEPGYERTIFIPNKIDGVSYTISQQNNYFVLTYKGNDLVFDIPEVTGSFQKNQNNTIRKQGDTVIIS